MSWWMPHEFARKRRFLEAKARALATIRRFFENQAFTEVQTPALQICPTIDTHIQAFQTFFQESGVGNQGKSMYLHTSPEFAMKKLLVAGMERIYQLGPAFRNGEKTRLHEPEFTLLEWYRTGADYKAMMTDCELLLRAVAQSYTYQGKVCNPHEEWQYLSIQEAFDRYVGINLELYLEDVDSFAKQAQEKGVRVIAADRWDDIFHAVMAEKIEPFLGTETPCILYDYPASMAALSRRKPEDKRYAERFELYVCGVELANAFSELTDASEQRMRAENDMALKMEIYGQSYPLDHEFFKALEFGMPECAGCALGFDRLVMLAVGAERIQDVLWAPVDIMD